MTNAIIYNFKYKHNHNK